MKSKSLKPSASAFISESWLCSNAMYILSLSEGMAVVTKVAPSRFKIDPMDMENPNSAAPESLDALDNKLIAKESLW